MIGHFLLSGGILLTLWLLAVVVRVVVEELRYRHDFESPRFAALRELGRVVDRSER